MTIPVLGGQVGSSGHLLRTHIQTSTSRNKLPKAVTQLTERPRASCYKSPSLRIGIYFLYSAAGVAQICSESYGYQSHSLELNQAVRSRVKAARPITSA